MTSEKNDNLLRIGQLAKLTGVTPRTIRFYVNQGLLPKPLKTYRNMAYYAYDCISMIKAIKKVQSERYLPLAAIRKMLEENDFDYSCLEIQAMPDTDIAETGSSHQVKRPAKSEIPHNILETLEAKGWLSSTNSGAGMGSRNALTYSTSGESIDSPLIDFLHECRKNSIEWEEVIDILSELSHHVEKLVRCEFKSFLQKPANDPTATFGRYIDLEKQVVGDFINMIRGQSLNKILKKHNENMDNALFAGMDEGYGIPLEEIEHDLNYLETSLDPESPQINILIDLATGYSCVGALDQAEAFLKRALNLEPDNIEALIRLLWYQRFSENNPEDRQYCTTKRDQLAEIVNNHPHNFIGRLFLSLWYACDSKDSDDPFESMRLIKSSIENLYAIEKLDLSDLHEWCLAQAHKGLIYTCILPSLGKQEEGIEAIEKIKARRGEIDAYYLKRMPFFPKWLWPNAFSVLGSAYLEMGRYKKAGHAFAEASAFKVSPFFEKRINENIRLVNEYLRSSSSL